MAGQQVISEESECQDGFRRCDSCGVECDSVEDLCHGCKADVCYACVLIWGHVGKGGHGKGDPAAELARLSGIERAAQEVVAAFNLPNPHSNYEIYNKLRAALAGES